MTIEVEVLERAKAYVKGRYTICYALYRIQVENSFTSHKGKPEYLSRGNTVHFNDVYARGGEINQEYAKVANSLTDLIVKRLGKNSGSLNAWLQVQGIPLSALTPERMRQHRLAWLDILIKEFS